jgi:hypothetical protein
MGDKVVTEDLLKDAMNGLVSKDKFQSDIDRLIASVTDVNKTVVTLSTKLDEHMRKTELDAGSFRLEQSRLNTKIDNVQTQLLEKQGRFDGESSSSSGGGELYGPPPLVHKLRFPKYDGTEDPLGWLHKCEQYFRSQGTPPAQHVWTAAFYLEGAASQWYFRLEKNQGESSWPDFIDGVKKRFGPPTRSNPLGELMHLRCSGTIDEFQENFLTLLARCDDINEKQQIAIFSAGLPPRWALTSTYRSMLFLMMPCPWHGLSSVAWRWPTTQLVSRRAAHARRLVPQGPLLRPPNPMRRQPARVLQQQHQAPLSSRQHRACASPASRRSRWPSTAWTASFTIARRNSPGNTSSNAR